MLGQPGDISVAENPTILKFGGLQLTFIKARDDHEFALSHIGLTFAPLWEPIPEVVRPVDFLPGPATTIDDVRNFLIAAGIAVHSSVVGEFESHLVVESGARITFGDGELQKISFARKAVPATRQVTISLPAETWDKAKALAENSGRTVPRVLAEWIAKQASGS